MWWLLPVAITLVRDIFVVDARYEAAVMGNSLRRARLENSLALRALHEKNQAENRQETAERMKTSATRNLTVLRRAAEDLRRAEATIGTVQTEAQLTDLGCESRILERLIRENETVLKDPLAAADAALSLEARAEPDSCLTFEELLQGLITA